MEPTHKQALQRNKMRLKDDLDVSGMVDCLVADDVITEEQQAGILAAETNGLRTIALLDILMDGGPKVYPLFVEYLEKMQPDLADGFPPIEGSSESSPSEISAVEKQKMFEERRAFLEEQLDPNRPNSGILIKLVHSEEILTLEECEQIKGLDSKLQQSKELLKCILKKGPTACMKFGECLGQTQSKLAESVAKYEEGNEKSIWHNLEALCEDHADVLVEPKGKTLISALIPMVQAVFPEHALVKSVNVRLQVLPVPSEVVTVKYGDAVTVGPIVTLAPQRRKFHRPIALKMPLPLNASQDTLHLMCCLAAAGKPIIFEDMSDITDTCPLEMIGDSWVGFNTTVSGVYWLMSFNKSHIKFKADKSPAVVANDLTEEASTRFLLSVMLGCSQATDFHHEPPSEKLPPDPPMKPPTCVLS